MIDFGVKDFLDILFFAILLHQSYKLMKSTGASSIFVGIVGFMLFWYVITRIFQMEIMRALLETVINIGAISFVIIFQTEIRRFFFRVGSSNSWKNFLGRKGWFSKKEKIIEFPIMKLVIACRDFSRSRTGALIVIQRNTQLDEYIATGEFIDAEISNRLIENIFFKNSPLHDGAMIIANTRIVAAAAILPVSQNKNISNRLGLRHRAALGLTERADAIVVVVSEETGHISVAMGGEIFSNLNEKTLEEKLSQELE